MIDKGIYTAGEIDSMWDKKMNDRFVQWLNDYQGSLPMTKDELERYLKARNF